MHAVQANARFCRNLAVSFSLDCLTGDSVQQDQRDKTHSAPSLHPAPTRQHTPQVIKMNYDCYKMKHRIKSRVLRGKENGNFSTQRVD
jgi:hypothetical protein